MKKAKPCIIISVRKNKCKHEVFSTPVFCGESLGKLVKSFDSHSRALVFAVNLRDEFGKGSTIRVLERTNRGKEGMSEIDAWGVKKNE